MIRSLAAALGSSSSRLPKALLVLVTKSRHGSPAAGLYGGAEPLGAPGCLSSRLPKVLLGVGTKSRHGSPAAGLYGGAEPLGVPGCSPKPPPQPWASTPFLSLDNILPGTLHHFRGYIKKHVEGGSENQLDELKLRLVALRIYKLHSTAEEILKDPRLDFESLPLVSKHDALECINKYICVLRTLDMNDAYFRCLIFLVIGDYINLSTSLSKLVEILGMSNHYLELHKFCLKSAVAEYIGLCDIHCPSSSEASKLILLEKLEQQKYYELSNFYTTGLDEALFTIKDFQSGTDEVSAAEHENGEDVSKPKLRATRKRKEHENGEDVSKPKLRATRKRKERKLVTTCTGIQKKRGPNCAPPEKGRKGNW